MWLARLATRIAGALGRPPRQMSPEKILAAIEDADIEKMEEIRARVDAVVKALLHASPAAVRACKRLVLDVAEREINPSLIAATVEGIADIRASEEGREGVQSFLQKRKPAWL